jgi:hypothetical protein
MILVDEIWFTRKRPLRIIPCRHSPQSLTGRMPDETARTAMQDLTMLLFTGIFFGLAFLYVKACQKLR